MTQVLAIPIITDYLVEGDEFFFITMSFEGPLQQDAQLGLRNMMIIIEDVEGVQPTSM